MFLSIKRFVDEEKQQGDSNLRQELDLLMAFDDPQAGRPGHDAGSQKHDDQRLAQLLTQGPDHCRKPQDGCYFIKGVSKNH